MSHTVRLEPVGLEIDCAPEETVLDAAFRQGLNLVYGCREGQCSACKCFLLEGDAELRRYSNFALSDTERANGYSLMCRAMPESDLVVELLHFDPDNLALEHPIRDGRATVETIEELTADITRLILSAPGFEFTPGQYVDLHVPGDPAGARRSFSMANLPGEDRIELMIKRYPGGKLSGLLAEARIRPGDEIAFTGPYGSLRARDGEAPILMVAGGSGMAPILSLLRRLAGDDCRRPIRFFYGARTEDDLFVLDEIAALGERLADFAFTPVTDRFVHEAVDEWLAVAEGFAGPDVYMCGPPPMLEAAEEMLLARGVDPGRIFQDKFTTAADAAGDGEAGGTVAPPVKRVDDGSAARGDESERQFGWFSPKRRRASLYEDVTVDTQPSIHRHLDRGWPVSFADGRGTWDDDSTALRATDWFDFRDPGEQWERTYYQLGTASEQQLEAAMRAAAQEGLLADFRPAWVEFLRETLQVPAYVEHGLWFAMATIARDCLSDSVATCVCLQAAMKQRAAQSIVLYAMDLEAHHGAFPIERSRDTFVSDPAWQPTRRYLERLAATADWGEVIIAANLCFEPVLGTVLRRELGTRAAAANGDTVTPALARVETQEWEWARAWSTEFVRFLLADPAHGEANRAQFAGWIRDWLPDAFEAAAALAPLAARVPGGFDIEAALDGVRHYTAAVLRESELGELTDLVGIAPEPAADAPAEPRRRVRRGPAQRSRIGGTPPEGRKDDGAGATPSAVPEVSPDGTYDFVGIVMAKSAEGDAVAAILGRRPGIRVIEQPAFWDIRAADRLVIPYAEVSDELGYEIDAYSIQHEMSTHYGRMVATDDSLKLFSDPTEAMEHLLS